MLQHWSGLFPTSRGAVVGRPAKAALRDWLIYFTFAVLVVAGFGSIFFYAASRQISDLLVVQWLNISVALGFVFGYTIGRFWRVRHWRLFWATLGVIVIVHFVLLSGLNLEKGAYFWLPIVVGLPEMFVVFLLFDLMYPRSTESASPENPDLAQASHQQPSDASK